MQTLLTIVAVVTGLTARAEVRLAHPLGDQCYHEDHVFKFCAHQTDLYNEAFTRAKLAGRKVLVVYGYDGCPWSRAMMNSLTTSAKSELIRSRFEIQPIAASAENPTGKGLVGELLREVVDDPEAFLKALPLVLIIDPNGEKTRAIKTLELERNDEATKWAGYDLVKVTKVLGLD